jgi:hypothetical protein
VQHVKAAERLDGRLDHTNNARLARDVDLGDDGAVELAGHTFGPGPSMSATTTEAPSRAISRAVASPMPLPAPVTIATLPSRRPIARVSPRAAPHRAWRTA